MSLGYKPWATRSQSLLTVGREWVPGSACHQPLPLTLAEPVDAVYGSLCCCGYPSFPSQCHITLPTNFTTLG